MVDAAEPRVDAPEFIAASTRRAASQTAQNGLPVHAPSISARACACWVLSVTLPGLAVFASLEALGLSALDALDADCAAPPELMRTIAPSMVTPLGPIVIELPPALRLIVPTAVMLTDVAASRWIASRAV